MFYRPASLSFSLLSALEHYGSQLNINHHKMEKWVLLVTQLQTIPEKRGGGEGGGK